ncbi:UDP-glucose/GDP-mannose dehydrogenase family protein [Sporosarcina sp. PTS2304]|uniref:UDP-glucose dehydrogenase family protein n=1 Tax=Sporosarcina sp. PTS2304 TaxID=2283194 RepID=UPI000E0DC563|nr:UDP-glucose/GDP-mannose dehydrogenase family protein [Sporosarcina sp. PTS2304]AXH98427.1 UDP-glucose/GDP-mannose dehydrogenase family protein [Sporosarcina sp. PTS2304]
MKVAVIGTGYVGLVTGTVLAEIGHCVTCIDLDEAKIRQLQSGEPTIYEPGLEELLVKNIARNNLHFTTNHAEAFQHADVILLAVGTPQGTNGEADLSYIQAAAQTIATTVTKDVVVMIKSTVPPGTNDQVEQLIRQQLIQDVKVDVVSNPEFLREGHAVEDAFHGDRIVIGSECAKAGEVVATLYAGLQMPVLHTNRRSAEMIKYAANAFLAVKISYINEIANLCDAIGADVSDVADGMGMDKRIGRAFLNAGIGYGGSCFPKDTEAIAHLAKERQTPLTIVESAIHSNQKQRQRFIDKIERYFHGQVANKKIAILGLAFKPNTDDLREAPSLEIIDALEKKGALISIYDPIITHPKSALSIIECVTEADAVVLVTEWQEFIESDWTAIGASVANRVLFDGRNALPANKLQQAGWTYIGIGKERK